MEVLNGLSKDVISFCLECAVLVAQAFSSVQAFVGVMHAFSITEEILDDRSTSLMSLTVVLDTVT
jgi:hypothetical protein